VTAVNDAPTVSTTAGSLAYTENDAATAVDAGLTVADVDSASLTGATVTISGNYTSGEDVLAFTDQLGITGSWDAGTGVLTLSGTTTVANYQAALRSVTYANTSESPSTAVRTVSFVVNDGALSSTAATRTVTVAAVNDAPTVTTTAGSLAYTENDAATSVDAGLTVGDVDSAALTGATVTISGNYASGQDVLAFTDQLGITGSWDAGTGVLTLSGTTTVANYQTALRSVTYENSSDAPSTLPRTVSFVVNDGALSSTASSRTVDIMATNDAPVVNDQAFALPENSGVGTLVGTVVASDLDTADTRTFSILAGNIGGAFSIDTATGEITVANPAALDFEGTPTFGLTVQVEDGGGLTDDATITVALSNLNEAPSVAGFAAALPESSAVGTVVGSAAGSDPDAGDVLSYAITGGNTGGAFAIDAVTGEITVANPAALDFETTPSFALIVSVTDALGLSTSTTVDVGLSDTLELNEVPADALDEPSETTPVDDESPAMESEASQGEVPLDRVEPQTSVATPTEARTPAPRPPMPEPTMASMEPPRHPAVIEPMEELAPAALPAPLLINVRGIDPQVADALEQIRDELDALDRERQLHEQTFVATAEGVAVVSSAAVAALLLRGASLGAALLSSLPLWWKVDPLAILSLSEDEREEFERELREARDDEDTSDRSVGRVLDGSIEEAPA
jgi:hypothetical protein